jgi:hypothetical protein
MSPSRVFVCVLVAIMVVVVVVAACSPSKNSSKSSSTPSAPPTTVAQAAAERLAAVKVVKSIRPGSAVGFDPAALRAASIPQSILPAGATLSPVAGSFDLRGASASLDVVMRVPGRALQTYWVLLRKVHGRWAIAGTFALGGV